MKKFTVDSYDGMFVYRSGVTRSTGHALSMPKFANNFERYLFKNRCINLCNALPEYVVKATSMRQFSKNLDSLNFNEIIKKKQIVTVRKVQIVGR